MDGADVGDCGADAGGGAAECVGVGVAEGEGAADVDLGDDDGDAATDEGAGGGETPALPHPIARKATSINAATFGYVTAGNHNITPCYLDRARGSAFWSCSCRLMLINDTKFELYSNATKPGA